MTSVFHRLTFAKGLATRSGKPLRYSSNKIAKHLKIICKTYKNDSSDKM